MYNQKYYLSHKKAMLRYQSKWRVEHPESPSTRQRDEYSARLEELAESHRVLELESLGDIK